MKFQRIKAALLPAVVLLSACAAAHADRPEHPAYVHALEDLRHARGLLDQLDAPQLENDERHAIAAIDAAIDEIKRASYDDGKDIHDHPPIDAHITNTDRFHKALEFLHKARGDSSREEDNPRTQGLQARVILHIDDAIHGVDHTIRQALE